jgi:hypothetical protein
MIRLVLVSNRVALLSQGLHRADLPSLLMP